MAKKYSVACILLFTLALILRLLLFSTYLKDNPCKLMYDAGHYHELAQSIATGNGFAHPDGAPQFYRVPGYSLFLALGYTLFGGSIDATLLMQIIFSAFIPILIFVLTQTLFPGAFVAACVAGVLTCLHPGFLIFSGLLMTETLFLIFLLLFFILFFTILKRQDSPWYLLLGAGLLLAAASLIRPVGLPVLLTSVFVLILTRYWQQFVSAHRPFDKLRVSAHIGPDSPECEAQLRVSKGEFLSATREALLVTSGWLIGVSWWLLRSWLLTGYIFFHTLPGVHFLNHAAARVVMRADDIDYRQAKQKLVDKLDARVRSKQKSYGRTLHAIEYCKIAEDVSKKAMLKHPFISLKLFCINMARTVFTLYSGELLVIENKGILPGYSSSRSWQEMVMRFMCPSVSTWWVQWFIVYELLLMVLMLVATICFFLKRLLKPTEWLLMLQILPLGMVFIVMSLACGFARLRLPIEPFFIIVSSIFMTKFLGRRQESE